MRTVWAAGTLLGVVVFVLLVRSFADDEPTRPSDADGGDRPSPTLAATRTVTSTPTSPPTSEPTPLTARAYIEAAYEPFAWDDPARVSRTPPPTRALAEAEAPIHRGESNVRRFQPAVFERPTLESEGCVDLDTTDARIVRSGDWVLDATGYPIGIEEWGTTPPTGVELFPADPEPLLSQFVKPLRIRMLNINNWRGTHLEEHYVRPTVNDDGSFSYRLTIESPWNARWMAIVTAEQHWGCFEFRGSLLKDETIWPRDVDVAEQVAPRSAPVCAPLGASQRFGEFTATELVERLAPPWDPSNRTGGRFALVAPATDPASENLELRAVLLQPRQVAPVYTYRLVAGPALRGVSSGTTPTYAIAPVLPRAGDWLVTAEAGPENWGCFQVTIEG